MIALLSFIIKYRFPLAVFATLCALAASLIYMRHAAYNDGERACTAKYEQAVAKADEEIKTRKKVIRHETQNLDRDGLIVELCRHGWVRDTENCPH